MINDPRYNESEDKTEYGSSEHLARFLQGNSEENTNYLKEFLEGDMSAEECADKCWPGDPLTGEPIMNDGTHGMTWYNQPLSNSMGIQSKREGRRNERRKRKQKAVYDRYRPSHCSRPIRTTLTSRGKFLFNTLGLVLAAIVIGIALAVGLYAAYYLGSNLPPF